MSEERDDAATLAWAEGLSQRFAGLELGSRTEAAEAVRLLEDVGRTLAGTLRERAELAEENERLKRRVARLENKLAAIQHMAKDIALYAERAVRAGGDH